MKAHVSVEDQHLESPHGPLRVRVYRPEAPAGPGLVWAHGGAFCAGDIDMPEADAVARGFAERGIVVVSVDYSLSPITAAWAALTARSPRPDGARYPVASDEVEAAFRWARKSSLAPGPWALGGASAGANLAAGAALRLSRNGSPRPALCALAYPTLHAPQPDATPDVKAVLEADPDGGGFHPDTLRAMYENYLGEPLAAADVYAIPGRAEASDLASFPPTFIVNSEVDGLRPSGEAFVGQLQGAGVSVDIVTEPGTRHGHLNDFSRPAAQATLDRFAERLLTLREPRA